MPSYKPYIDFIRYSIRSLPAVPDSCSEINWADYYDFCLRQGIAGLVYDGLERSKLRIPQSMLFGWIGMSESIKSTNLIIDKQCQQICRFWEKQDYCFCILKGQVNATMYPNPELRSPGDIDIWVYKNDDRRCKKAEDKVAEIIRIAQHVAPKGHYSLHHVTMPVFNDTSVEVHYRPVFLDNWWKDKKLIRYVNEVKEEQFKNKITLADGESEVCGLTDEFNAVFLLLHMWHHLLSTRNNFKQLIDYYFLLKRDIPTKKREAIGWIFKDLGVLKYARGIMWIENKILGLPYNYLIVDPDEKIGQLLLNETLHYGENKKKRGKVGTLISRVTRNVHLFWYFPSPVLIAPIYLMWHQWWKLKMRLKIRKA